MKRFVTLIIALAIAVSICTPIKAAFASVDETKYYNYLKKIYDQKNPKLNKYLISECKRFLKIFGHSRGMAAEVRYVIGLLYMEEKEYPLAVATFLKGLFLDPVSERMNDEREQIKKIISDHGHFKPFRDKIDRITEGPFIDKAQADKFYDFLKALYEINDEDLYAYTVQQSMMLVSEFPKCDHVEDVQTRVAQVYSIQGDYLESIAVYEKVEALFPASKNIPRNRFAVANLRYRELKEYDGALSEFKYITETYPQEDVSGDSYFLMGEINEEKFKNYTEAINDYESVPMKYPTNQHAVESLFRVADIYLKDLNDNDRAIEVLSRVGRDFSGDARAPESYDKIAEIYSGRMKDYDSAITTYKKLAETYPENPNSPEKLYEAARMAEGKLKDYGNAISLYEDLQSMFAQSKYAKKAASRAASLKKKIREK